MGVGGGGYPSLSRVVEGTPVLSWLGGGVPESCPGWGTSWKESGTRDLRKNQGLGTSLGCGQTHTFENNTFPILRMQAVMIPNLVTVDPGLRSNLQLMKVSTFVWHAVCDS